MNEFISLTCPACGGSLKIQDFKKKYYCQYCGNEILVKTGSDLDKSITKLAISSLSEEVNDLNRTKQELYKQLVGYDKLITSVRNGKSLRKISLSSLFVFLTLISVFFVLPGFVNMGYIMQKILSAIPGAQFLLWLILLASFIAFILGLSKYVRISQIDVVELQTARGNVKTKLTQLVNISTEKQEELNSYREIARYK